MRGNLAKATLHLHLTTIGLLAECVGWDRTLDRITVRDIEKFRSKRLETGISASSANKEVKALRRVFNLAILRGYLAPDHNPCQGIPMIRVAPKQPRYVSPDEFGLIFHQAPDTLWRAFLVTLYTTAIRRSEAMHLLWQNIDFESCELHVTRTTAEGFVQPWTPKDHEMRSIPLPRQAISLLAAWQGLAPEGCPYAFMDQGRWEYCRAEMEAGRWDPEQSLVNNVLRRFKTMCRRAGVGPFTIHDLRRSCITNWGRELPIHVVKQLAGHSDIKTTQQFYLSVQPEDLVKAKSLQATMLGEIPESDPTDLKVTHSGPKRVFPGRKVFRGVAEALECQEVGNYTRHDSNV